MIALVLATLQGCAFGLEELEALDTGIVNTGTIRITGIEPSSGPINAKNEVTITGEDFTGEVIVKFGGAEAYDVTKVDNQTIVLKSPKSTTPVTVDVQVISEAGVATKAAAFSYYDDGSSTDTGVGPDDTGDTQDSGPDLPAPRGGLVEFGLLQIACPDCFGMTDDVSVWASAAFHEETTQSWSAWIPSAGTCVENPTASAPASTFLDVGDWVYLQSGSNSLGLLATTSNSGPLYQASGLTEADFPRNTSFDLSVPQGGADAGAFNVASAITTPNGFTSITPQQLLYTSTTQAFTAPLYRTGTIISWTPSGGSDLVVVRLDVYNNNGSTFLTSIVCTDNDDGSISMPSSSLSSLSTGNLVAVYINRYTIGAFSFPDGGNGETVSTIGVLGTARVQ